MAGKKKRRSTSFGVRFDREGRMIITSSALRKRIEKRLLTQGDLEIVHPVIAPPPVGLNTMCPPGPTSPKPQPNTMCACAFALTGRKVQVEAPVKRAPRGN